MAQKEVNIPTLEELEFGFLIVDEKSALPKSMSAAMDNLNEAAISLMRE